MKSEHFLQLQSESDYVGGVLLSQFLLSAPNSVITDLGIGRFSLPLSQLLTVILPLLALGALVLYLKVYFSRVRSNAFSRRDYRRVLIVLLLAALIVVEPVARLCSLQSPHQILGLTLALLVAALLITMLIRRAAKPWKMAGSLLDAALAKSPYLIRFWPSWVLADTVMTLNQTSVVEFSLVESMFDLNLVLFSPTDPLKPSKQIQADLLDNQQKEAILSSQSISYPLSDYEEKAITQTGMFYTDRTVELVCEAPNFEPPHMHIRTTIDALTKNSVSIPLLPKSIGKRQIIFYLIDSKGSVAGSLRIECTVVSSRTKLIAWVSKSTLALAPLAGLIKAIVFLVEKARAAGLIKEIVFLIEKIKEIILR